MHRTSQIPERNTTVLKGTEHGTLVPMQELYSHAHACTLSTQWLLHQSPYHDFLSRPRWRLPSRHFVGPKHTTEQSVGEVDNIIHGRTSPELSPGTSKVFRQLSTIDSYFHLRHTRSRIPWSRIPNLQKFTLTQVSTQSLRQKLHTRTAIHTCSSASRREAHHRDEMLRGPKS